MSLSAAVIDALLEAGATREQIAAAVKADIAVREAAAAAKLEKRRAGNRERQQRKRDRDNNEESRVTCVTERDARDGSPKEYIQTPSDSQKPDPSGSVKKFPAPDGVTAEQWQAFRKQRKKALSPHSYALVCKKLSQLAEAGWPPGEMIDLAIERGWETVFAPRNFDRERSKPSPLDQLVAASFGLGAGGCEDTPAGSPGIDGSRGAVVVHRIGGGRT